MPMSKVRLTAERESMSEVDAGFVLYGGREQHLYRRQAVDRSQCRRRQGRGDAGEAGAGADGGGGAA